MERVAILGTGLIGGSIGLGLSASDPAVEVVGYDRDPAAAEAALRAGAVQAVEAGPAAAAAEADLVVLAAPVDATQHLVAELQGHVAGGAVVTDVGSAKAAAVAVGERAFGRSFVGGHPMAGSERHGIDAASPDLFRDAWWILTPTRTTAPEAYARVADLAGRLGAKPVAVSPSR
ncbi:MAG: prephenate dehydrogenase/arogenate dehydrogenase family protein, partial [Actinomycetota bacterium]|nr:prephenate dehydrogenase/arogenate dehydrogenase family protein [Actinomycetota bacterium]